MRHQKLPSSLIIALAALAPLVAGCSGGTDLLSKDAEWFQRPGRLFIKSISIESPPLTPDKPVTAEDLVSADGACPGMAERLNIARLRAALTAGEDASVDLVVPADADPALVATQRQLLASQVGEHRAKLAALARQEAQKDAEHQTIAATIHKLDALLPVTQQRVEIRKTLMEKEIGSKLTYYETLQLQIEQQEELRVQNSRLKEAESAVAAIRETRTQAVAEYRKTISDELAKSEQKANSVARDLIKAEQRTSLQQLASPVDGVVQQLAVHTVGGVVTPAQSLLVIVPSDTRLEVEAMISNRDIGFVEAGQGAAIKIDTFNFTRYGLLEGRVLSVSQDAIIRDRPPERGDRALGQQHAGHHDQPVRDHQAVGTARRRQGLPCRRRAA